MMPAAAPRDEAPYTPIHRAEDIRRGHSEARLAHVAETHVLRLTRAGKLILTK